MNTPSSTWSLPSPPGAAVPLVSADFVDAAKQLRVEPAAIRAVARVESSGRSGFDHKKRPMIRYENHVFRTLTHHRFDASHPNLSSSYRSHEYQATHQFSGDRYADEQWGLLEQAFELAPNQAVMACSWGMFQVMGENYRNAGWTSPEQFVKDMFYSAAQHLRAFLGVCRQNRLVPYLANHEWSRFAQGYNGPDYRSNRYDAQLASYYAQYSRAF